jgi:hypothetical protein
MDGGSGVRETVAVMWIRSVGFRVVVVVVMPESKLRTEVRRRGLLIV